ncbi:hypothetical protein HYO42_04875 [Vibrio parahaemolyticus]|uniref:hypothetical protein n=1 Tax=Vibrio parahaemolyticus TaxID=670 RepID=UPI0006C247F7|nr:hypothetical protein [Vibrio parahaemolyticus]ELA8169398.1 hypothetical protein [Vibrio parahaemolyticus]KON59734.1 hypothetical protein ACX02_04510 [Vibrio parahaemolyticus]MBM4883811.1 hypothetical protein [Vibrio parahaemolyticus]MCS0034715.1 hypothetical protein [Vibrio parahaemolyticus]
MMVFNLHLSRATTLLGAALAAFTLSSSLALANPTEQLLTRFNQAAQGDTGLVDTVHDELSQLVQKQGATPVTLVYLGSSETLQGRDAFMPWNKMKFTERGLATIQKGLDLMANQPMPIQEQQRLQGLPEYQLATAIAATTYTSLPDMFNHFERGYELYLTLLDEPSFNQQPFAATAWVYLYAIEAALRAEDMEQAQKWLAKMESFDSTHLETQTAKALLAKH